MSTVAEVLTLVRDGPTSGAMAFRADGSRRMTAGTLARWRFVFDARGALPAGARFAVAHRWPCDWGNAHGRNPKGEVCLTARTSDGVPSRWWTARRHLWHPFDHVLFVEVSDGRARGASVEFHFGDGWAGPPGFRVEAHVPGKPALDASSNPVVAGGDAPPLLWRDLHGQSVIGCGARTIEAYDADARDFAAADVASHQTNCFLGSREEWAQAVASTREHREPGRFAPFLGVGRSAVSSLGGDHNVSFPGADAELRRHSHAFLPDGSDEATDLAHMDDLPRHHRGSDTILAPHVGGRTANLDWHEPSLDRLLEVHSTHATSEWFLVEALRRGCRMGAVARSEGADGRSAASHPGHRGVRDVDAQGVRRRSIAAGDRVGTVLDLSERGRSELVFATEPITLRVRLDVRGSMSRRFDLTNPDRSLELRWLPEQAPPRSLRTRVAGPAPAPGTHACRVRVRLSGGSFARSSPMFLTVRSA